VKYAGWAVVGLVFFGLTFVVGHTPAAEPTHWAQGNDLLAPRAQHDGPTAVRGTVDRVGTTATGSRTLHLIADDGAPVMVMIPPTVNARMPKSGDRVSVTGTQLGAGALTLLEGGGLQFLPPAPSSSRREMRYGRLGSIERLPSGAHRASLLGVRGEFVLPVLVQKGIALPHQDDPSYEMRGYIGHDGTYVVESLE